jgi:cytochrome P450
VEGGEQKTRRHPFPFSSLILLQHRMITRPFFANDRTSDLELFDKYISKALNHISNLKPNQPIDFEDLSARFTIDAASEFLFGQTLDTLSYRVDGFDSFIDAVAKIQQVTIERTFRGGFWPLFELFGDKAKKYGDIIKEWIAPLVERALEHKREMSKNGQQIRTDRCTFLEYLTHNFDGNSPFRCRILLLTLRIL